MDNAYVRMQYAFILNPIEHLFPKARAELLNLLFNDPTRSLHLRDLARLSGLALGTIQREVANLREAELISERRDGNRLYFVANTQHPLFPELQRIAQKTTGIPAQLRTALSGLTGIQLAFVYGSLAQGSVKVASDVDLFIIGSVSLRTLAGYLREVADQVNREINPTVFSPTSYRDKLTAKDAYICNVTESPKLWIIGNENELAAMA